MPAWAVHWLEAEGDLGPWREAVGASLARAEAALATHVDPPRLDLLVAWRPRDAMPEDGIGGFAHGPRLLSLSLDPRNPAFGGALGEGAVTRAALHEAHHCLRMAGPGYGATLGEAIASEGLAGLFVQRALGTPPEAWEAGCDAATLAAHRPDEGELASLGYDHADWFFGAGARPRWLGYALGHEAALRWEARARPRAWDWFHAPAAEVLAA